ncbi:MAG: hypothetical protein H8K08_15890 [Nitrospira sp.]|nr:hypothetical protein [Nitrospira sp.]
MKLTVSGLRLSSVAQRGLVPVVLLALTATALLASAYTFVRVPAQQRVWLSAQTYDKAKQQQGQLLAARAMQERARDAAREVSGVWKGLPTEVEFASLAVAITELGRVEQVGIPGMAYRVAKREGPLPVKATMSFKVSGDYGAVYRFLHRLETAKSYLVIESLDAARADKSAQAKSHVVVCNITVATFLRPVAPTAEES